MPRVCDNCGRHVAAKQTMFSLRIEMFAETGTLEIDSDDLAQDHVANMEKLIQELEEIDPEEAADEVYEEYTFSVCGRCRRSMHQGFKDKTRSKS